MRVAFVLADAFGPSGVGQAARLAAALSRLPEADVEIVSLVRAGRRPVLGIPDSVRIGYLLDLRDPATARRATRSGSSTLVPAQVPEFREFTQETDRVLAAFAQQHAADVVVVDGLGLSIALARCAPSFPVVALASHGPGSVPSPVLAQLVDCAGKIHAVACTVEGREWGVAVGDAMPVWPTPWVVPEPGPLRADPRATCVVAVGPFAPDSRFDEIIEAFAQVAPDRPDWDLVLFGSGPQVTSLEETVTRLGVSGRVTFSRRGENVLEELACASVLVSPADRDGDGAVVAAAMRVGLAVISAERPEVSRDLVVDSQSGLIVPVGDAAALAQALARVIDDVTLRERLAEGGVRQAEKVSAPNVASAFSERLAGVARPARRRGSGIRRRRVASGRR